MQRSGMAPITKQNETFIHGFEGVLPNLAWVPFKDTLAPYVRLFRGPVGSTADHRFVYATQSSQGTSFLVGIRALVLLYTCTVPEIPRALGTVLTVHNSGPD